MFHPVPGIMIITSYNEMIVLYALRQYMFGLMCTRETYLCTLFGMYLGNVGNGFEIIHAWDNVYQNYRTCLCTFYDMYLENVGNEFEMIHVWDNVYQ